MVQKIVCCFLWVLIIGSLQAQNNNLGMPFIQNYDKKTYKAGTQTGEIQQDKRGVLYFANNDGLLTFNSQVWHFIPFAQPNHCTFFGDCRRGIAHFGERRLLLEHHEGTFRIEGNRATKLLDKNGVWSFLKSSEQSLLVGDYKGLILFEEMIFRKILEGLEVSCRIMTANENGVIWVTHPYQETYTILLKAENTAIDKVQFYDSNADLLFNHVFKNVLVL
ncbi:MAG: hypothetical protein ACPG49_01550 [Chitinophagales bacterium]